MQKPPFGVTLELDGWRLFWASLRAAEPDHQRLASLRKETARQVRNSLTMESLPRHPTLLALRRLFKEAGCDPSRYRPSSEALLRRLLKGGEIPSIHPLVDLNNCLSAVLVVPCCVMSSGTFVPPFTFRSGRAGETYESLKGPFQLEGKPLLLDTLGPLDAPITGSERVKVTEETTDALLVAYLPKGAVTAELAAETLAQLLDTAPVAKVRLAAAS